MVAVTQALADDLSEGEPEDARGVPEAETGRGRIVCRVPGILAGVPVAREAFARVGVRLRPLVGEGARARAGEAVAEPCRIGPRSIRFTRHCPKWLLGSSGTAARICLGARGCGRTPPGSVPKASRLRASPNRCHSSSWLAG